MTENKRFEYIEATDWIDEHIIDHNTEPRFEHYFLKSVTDKMNVLNDENQKLKEENEQLKNELARQQLINTSIKTEKGIDKLQSKIKELIDENEQLKQFQDRVFNIIDKNIDELQKKYDFGQKNGMCPMHNILYSINTLKDLKKELKE